MSRAMVVLPVPGGPQRITDDSRSASMSARSGLPGAEQVALADDLVEGAGPQPGRQRRRRASRSSAPALNRSADTGRCAATR